MGMLRMLSAALAATFCPALLPTDAVGQCSQHWRLGPAAGGALVSGLGNSAYAMATWDPDGAGPLQEWLVVGGAFTVAGAMRAHHIAAFDPSTASWRPIGPGFDGDVLALAVLPNGDLVAAGGFSFAGATACANVARWDGSSWTPLGTGTDGTVRALATLPGGALFAGGDFGNAGGAPAAYVARWDGASWSNVGAGTDAPVHALLSDQGTLVVGGGFAQAGGSPAPRAARWDGTQWTALGSQLVGTVKTLTIGPSGSLLAGGSDLIPMGTGTYRDGVALWTGTGWTAWASPIGPTVADMLSSSAAGLMVGTPYGVSRWTGSSWLPIASTSSPVRCLTEGPGGRLFLGGDFTSVSGTSARHVVGQDANGWLPVPATASLGVLDVFPLPAGELLACGDFVFSGVRHHVGRWTGTSWQTIGSGLPEAATSIVMRPNGEIVCSHVWPGTHERLARFDGSSWTPLAVPAPMTGVSELEVLPNGDLVAAGYGMARWTGSSWHAYPAGYPHPVEKVAVRPNGNLVVVGQVSSTGYTVAEWDGQGWLPYPIDANCSDAAILPNGDIVVVGGFTTIGNTVAYYAARWDGQSWHALGAGLPSPAAACTVLPDGDVLASCRWSSTPHLTSRVFRFSGQTWSMVDVAGEAVEIFGLPRDIEPPIHGDVILHGRFQTVSGGPSYGFAALTPDCPPAAAVYGSGCAGSGSPLVLTADGLPWLDATFRARCTGAPPNSIAVGVYGFTQASTPLPTLHPLGQAGCILLVDNLAVLSAAAGGPVVRTAIAIPNLPLLIGADFFHQVVPIELDSAGDIVALTSSNALQLTIGTY